MNKNIFTIKILFLVVLLALVSCAANSLNADHFSTEVSVLEIELKDKAVINSANVKIGDVATVVSSDIDLSLLIDDLLIGKAPWPGNSRVIELSEIMSLLLKNGIDLSKVNFVGAHDVRVSVKSLVIPGTQIAEHAESYLLKSLESKGADNIIVELQNAPKDQIVPLGEGDVKLKFLRIGMGQSGKQAHLSMRIMVDGTVYKGIELTFNVGLYKNVVVVQDKIKRGEVILKDSVQLETVEMNKIDKSSFYNVDDVVGMVTLKYLKRGSFITEDAVRKMSAVRKGDSVVILIGNSGLEVVSKGVCQQSAGFGDLVKVVNVDTKKILYGNVIDSGTVRIRF